MGEPAAKLALALGGGCGIMVIVGGIVALNGG
jgi:hypothetical protein